MTNTLATLTGSDKQIAFGNDLRDKAICAYAKYHSASRDARADAWWGIAQEGPAKWQAKADAQGDAEDAGKRLADEEHLWEQLLSQSDAAWWIDNKINHNIWIAASYLAAVAFAG